MKRKEKDMVLAQKYKDRIGQDAANIVLVEPDMLEILIAWYEGKEITIGNHICREIPGGSKMCVELGMDPEIPELYVGLQKDGNYVQDLAVVRPKYNLTNEEFQISEDTVEVLVYGDETREDYTDRFEIKVREEEE